MSKNTGRASGASQAFSRLSTPKTTKTSEPIETSDTPKAKTSPSTPATKRSKYTLLLTDDDALLLDQLALTLRRDLGRKTDKSAILRALIYLSAEDEDLRRELTEVLRREDVTA